MRQGDALWQHDECLDLGLEEGCARHVTVARWAGATARPGTTMTSMGIERPKAVPCTATLRQGETGSVANYRKQES
jgi:hypothetical protein